MSSGVRRSLSRAMAISADTNFRPGPMGQPMSCARRRQLWDRTLGYQQNGPKTAGRAVEPRPQNLRSADFPRGAENWCVLLFTHGTVSLCILLPEDCLRGLSP